VAKAPNKEYRYLLQPSMDVLSFSKFPTSSTTGINRAGSISSNQILEGGFSDLSTDPATNSATLTSVQPSLNLSTTDNVPTL